MYKYIIPVGFIAVMVGLALFTPTSYEFEKSEPNVVEKKVEVTPDWANDEDAVKAAQDVIRKKELEAREAELVSEITTLQEDLDTVRKELGTYWTRENIKRLIRQTFPEDPHTAVAVATCESGLKAGAYNDKNVTPTYDSGIFQINSVHHERMVALNLNKWDVEDNVRFARILYEEQGWQPWVCYWKGMHLAHL